jgi:hypothetical protein
MNIGSFNNSNLSRKRTFTYYIIVVHETQMNRGQIIIRTINIILECDFITIGYVHNRSF